MFRFNRFCNHARSIGARTTTVAVFVTAIFTQVARADGPAYVIRDDIKDGKLTEHGTPGYGVRVRWSGVVSGQRVPIGQEMAGIIPASGTLDFPLPPGGKAPDAFGNMRKIVDAYQTLQIPPPQRSANGRDGPDGVGGPINALEIAAFHAIPEGFEITGWTNFVHDRLGAGNELLIPDLFADTTADGVMDAADTLYSAVNLEEFYPSGVGAAMGQTFSIVNGTTPALPGMWFGTTQVVPNAASSTGYDNSAPFTGEATVMAFHGITSTPEAGSASVMLAGAMLALVRRRRAV